MEPLITTVIPNYKRPELLRRAVKSVLAQTYPHFQVCIYDDASGDETVSVVDEIVRADSRVKFYCHPRNIGGCKNFIYGMERVDTPFFSFLSNDDVLLPRFFERALEGFEKYPDAVFSVLATLQIDDKGRVLSEPISGWQEGFYCPPEGLLAMLKWTQPGWTSILFRREVIEKVGILDEGTGAPMDLDYELRIAARWPFVVSREPGAVFFCHPNAWSSKERLESLWPCWQKIIRNLTEDERLPSDVRLYARESLHRFFRTHYIALGGLPLVIQKEWEEAEQAAAILGGQYGLRGQALLLRSLSWAARHLPPTYAMLSSLNAFRKRVRSFTHRHVQDRYGAFARFLDATNLAGEHSEHKFAGKGAQPGVRTGDNGSRS